jgi:acyl carrier protein
MMTLTTNAPLFTRLTAVIRDVFRCPAVPIARETSSLDIDGWDSLSHTILLLRVEKEFGVRLPLDRTRSVANVGDLADLLAPLIAPESTTAVVREETRWIILHGNCQMGFLGTLLQPIVAPLGYKVAHIASAPQLGGNFTPEPQQAAGCHVFIEQVSSISTQIALPPTYKTDFPKNCRHLRLPVLWLKSLWPLQRADPRNVKTETEAVGKHPYGDAVVLRLMEEYKDPEEVLRRYMATDITTMIDLDRLHEMMMAEAVASDQLADVPFAAMVEANFRKTRLFDTINHPSHQLIVQLRDIVAPLILDGEADPDLQPVPEPVPLTQVPIHPQVIEHFKLEWTSPEATHLYFGKPLTFEQYLRAYIAFE